MDRLQRMSQGDGSAEATWQVTHGAGQRAALAALAGVNWLAVIACISGGGVLVVSLANWASIREFAWAELLFWVGLLVIFVPTAIRLFSQQATEGERVSLVVMLILALYLVKIIHSPSAFTFPDEFIHLRNLDNILATGNLFETNAILPATPLYPGLEIVASALAKLGRLSAFQAGLVLIGAARVVLALALFLLFQRLSGSARLAGVGVLVYAANSNFSYWSAQFSYESLSLPIAVMLLYALVRRANSHQSMRLGLGFVIVLSILTVVVTHHLTTYVVVGLLWMLVILYAVRFKSLADSPWRFAVFATLAALAWFVLIASATAQYLGPVFRDAILGVARFVSDPTSGRQLFQSASGAVSPLWERGIGIASVAIIMLVLPFGLWRAWRRYRRSPFVLALAAISLAYPALLLLRFIRSSWEISNRASEFMFLGLGFVVALALVEFGIPERLARIQGFRAVSARISTYPIAAAALPAAVTVLFLGGVIAGWPPNGRLAHPHNVQAGNTILEPQSVVAAEWSRILLGENNRIAADYVNGRFLLAYGNQYALTGGARGINAMLESTVVDRGVLEILQTNRVQYVVVDRRLASRDPVQGVYFSQADLAPGQYYNQEVENKFEEQKGVNLVFDSGDLLIYDVGVLSHAPATR